MERGEDNPSPLFAYKPILLFIGFGVKKMKRYLMRTTLLVYVGYVALLTALAYNPAANTSSRGLIALALILFVLWFAKGESWGSYATYVW